MLKPIPQENPAAKASSPAAKQNRSKKRSPSKHTPKKSRAKARCRAPARCRCQADATRHEEHAAWHQKPKNHTRAEILNEKDSTRDEGIIRTTHKQLTTLIAEKFTSPDLIKSAIYDLQRSILALQRKRLIILKKTKKKK